MLWSQQSIRHNSTRELHMNVRSTTVFALTAILAAAGTCLAHQPGQPGQPGGGGRQPGGQPGSPGGPGGAGGGGGNLVERLLQSDANGDGMLQWEEVPEQMRERIFERNDTNKDKVLDKAELETMRQRAAGRQGGPGGPGGPGGEAASMHDSMQAAGRAMRTLRRSEFSTVSRTQDLRAVQSLQASLIAAKGDMSSATMSEAAKAKYKDDTAAYQRDFRKSIIKSAMLALELELAINDGDSAAATKARDAILAHQEASHELFQPSEEERPAGEPGAGGGRGRGPGGGGGSGGQGGQPGGGRPPR
jgi:hypothetical protein